MLKEHCIIGSTDLIKQPRHQQNAEPGNCYVQLDRVLLASCQTVGQGELLNTERKNARISSEHYGKAKPVPYRAPEDILGLKWGNTVDIWSVGLLV